MLQTNFLTLNSKINQTVQIGGFVNSIRDHGGLIFIDLRSQSELIQCVINPENNQEIFDLAQSIGNEFVLKVAGKIVQRDPKLVNPKIPTGSVELIVEKLEIVAKAAVLPFEIDGQNLANEETRLKYRYLDLRRAKLKEMLTTKSKLFLAVRTWFDAQDFVEVQTPILANSSPEGARDFLVPSRLHPGKFYALPQAPQQFKQLLMVGGFNKYFQIAPCFRDEDPRADRHPGDFYQIDCEIAWADQDDIYDFSWKFIREVLAGPGLKVGNQTMSFTTKKLDPEFTKIRYDEAMDWFGSDKPDLRIRQDGEKLKMNNEAIKTEKSPSYKEGARRAEGVLGIEHTQSLAAHPSSRPLGRLEQVQAKLESEENPNPNLKAEIEKLEQKITAQGKAILVDCLIFNEQGQVFVQKRSAQRRLYPNSWDLPGGHVDEGDTVWETINKEVKEETNWQVSEVVNLFHSMEWTVPVESQKVGDNPNKVVLQFVVKVKSTDNLVLEEGKVTESRWVSLGEDLEFLKENKTEDFYIYNTVKKALELQNLASNSLNTTQNQNWIINNLGWIDAKPLFKNSAFKTFADLCEDSYYNDLSETKNSYKLEPRNLNCEFSWDNVYDPKNFIFNFYRKNNSGIVQPGSDFSLAKVILETDKSGIFILKVADARENNVALQFNPDDYLEEILSEVFKYAVANFKFKILKCFIPSKNTFTFEIPDLMRRLNWVFVDSDGTNEIYQIPNPNYQPSNSRVQALVIKNAVDKFSRSDLDKIQELGRSFGLPGIAYIQFESSINNEKLGVKNEKVESPSYQEGARRAEGVMETENNKHTPSLSAHPSKEGTLVAKSPILKFFGDENVQKTKQQEIVEFLGIEAGDLVLFLAHNDKNLVHKAQNAIRKHVAGKLDLLDQNLLKFVWIYDFPFFEEVETQHTPSLSAHPSQEGTIQVDFAHNPFGIFQNWDGLTHLETLRLAKEQNRLLELRAVQYDIACNGYEVLSGGRRNNIPECLMEGFKLVGYSEEEVQEKFGHMMEAYSYGAPAHAGFAWGLDRLFMVLVDENNIRETIAFPKNGSGMDLMMNSPSSVRPSQLKELSVRSV